MTLRKTLKPGDKLIIGDVEIICYEAARRSGLSLSIAAPRETVVVHEKRSEMEAAAALRRASG